MEEASHEEEVLKAQLCISELQVDASQFEARMRLIRVISRLPSGSRFRPAHADAYWELYGHPDAGPSRGRCLLELAGLYGNWPSEEDRQFRRALYTAACRLLAQDADSAGLQAAAIAGLGDLEAGTENSERARVLYGAVFRDFAATPAWGCSAFNYGLLLRQGGYPAAATEAFRAILGSGVNDRDPGPHLMEAYRNYRHRAATEICRSYRDRYDLPRGYYWKFLSTYRYPYLTWCGTCRRSEARRATRELALSSMRAGPLFVAANLTAAPRQNWLVWLIVGLVGATWWYVQRR
jgi:hypothetical protein